MNLEFFIAKRIQSDRKRGKSVSRPAVRVAMLGIALGVAVMLITVAIVIGFKKEIRSKVIAFGSHIQVTNFDSNASFETNPIWVTDSLVHSIATVEGVRHIQSFGIKPGIIKTDEDVQTAIFKGIDRNFDWNFYRKNLVQGDSITFGNDGLPSREVIISQYIADLMRLEVGSAFLAYFVHDENIRARKFTVTGIYCTNFVEYDRQFILTDLRQIQQINQWDTAQVSGLEILIDDYSRLNELGDAVYFKTANRFGSDGSTFLTRTIEDLNPQVFAWLGMLDMNVWIILSLMLIVAGFNMISGLLILILERTNMIGILKAIGAADWSVRKIFLYHSFFLIGRGMLWGNLLGLGLLLLQYFTHIVPLDAAYYYVDFVPVDFNIWHILLINTGAFVGSALMLLLPSYIITKISPAKAIKFE
ncbi:MAG: ABC transporter permease [Prevotellaceae bacterium]|jgi:lipoprotein-releasing system permease protein|nr:ABC transporter permease [Prevotellaceae bacterium]